MTIFDYYIYKTVFSPVFMFNSLFLLIISLSSMRLYMTLSQETRHQNR